MLRNVLTYPHPGSTELRPSGEGRPIEAAQRALESLTPSGPGRLSHLVESSRRNRWLISRFSSRSQLTMVGQQGGQLIGRMVKVEELTHACPSRKAQFAA